jgi:putative ABC transport system permease protein
VKKLIILAKRNVFRNRRRSIITMATTALAVFIMINVLSYVAGLYDGMVKVVLNTGIGHIQIHHSGFNQALKNGTVSTNLLMSETNIDQLLNDQILNGKVQKVSKRVLFSGLIGKDSVTTDGLVMGMEPEVEKDFYKSLSISKGRSLNRYDANGILVSKRIQGVYDINPGDKINLGVLLANGEFEIKDFEVIGVFDTGTDFNIRYVVDVMLNLDTARNLIGGDELTEVTLLLEDIKNTDVVVADLQAATRSSSLDIEVNGWQDLGKKLLGIATYIRTGMRVWMGIIFICASLAILNTFLMSVYERTHEIGILKAIGMKRRRILALILMETIILNLFALAVGLIIAALSVYILNRIGLPSMVQDFLPKGEAVHPYIQFSDTIISLLTIIGISALAGLVPAWQASRMNPVDALRYE